MAVAPSQVMPMNQRARADKELPAFEPSKLWTVASLAKHCEVSERTIERLVKEGQLKAVRVRGSVRITHQSYLEFIATARAPK
jgi:excisionase family DNA binding protein